jgi:predicted transcriptional regulator
MRAVTKDDRVGFRLPPEVMQKLDELAQTAGTSRHHIARELVVMSLTTAERDQLLVSAIVEIGDGVEELYQHMKALEDYLSRQSASLASAVEWLSLLISSPERLPVDPEVLHQTVRELFFPDIDTDSL